MKNLHLVELGLVVLYVAATSIAAAQTTQSTSPAASVVFSSSSPEAQPSNNGQVNITVEIVGNDNAPADVDWHWQWRGHDQSILAQGDRHSVLTAGKPIKVPLSLKTAGYRHYELHVQWNENGRSFSFIHDVVTDQTTGPRRAMLLSGMWQQAQTKGYFPFAKKNRAQPPAIPSDLKWKDVEIPLGLAPAEGVIHWFRRSITAPQWLGKGVADLGFWGLGRRAHIWINGRHVGYFEGAWTDCRFDLDKAFVPGKSNEILIAVSDWHSQKQDPARGDKYNWPVGHRGNRYNGLYDHVWLETHPKISISDWVWRYDHDKKTLTLTLTLHNASSHAFTGVVHANLLDHGQDTPFGAARSVSMVAGTSKRVDIIVPVAGAKLWWPNLPDAPGGPFLYGLRLQLNNAAGERVDQRNERLGLREFTYNGGQYRVNGIPVHLLARGFGGWYAPMSYAKARLLVQPADRKPASIGRIHTNPIRHNLAEMADEVGYMLQIESPFHSSGYTYPLEDPDFWANYKTQLEEIFHSYKNLPSVVGWSLENETFLCGAEKFKGALDRMAETWKWFSELDPDRPAVVNGDGDLRGRIDTINLHYPRHLSRHAELPQAAFWLQRGKELKLDLYPGKIVWKENQPLEIGEDQWSGFSAWPFGCSILMGDQVFADHQAAQAGHDQAARLYMLGYRNSGVSLYQPWSPTSRAVIDEAWQPIAAYVIDQSRNFNGGQDVSWQVNLHNDTLAAHQLTVCFRIGKQPFTLMPAVSLEPAGKKRLTLKFKAPEVSADKAVSFTLQVVDEHQKVRFSDQFNLYLRPTLTIHAPPDLSLFTLSASSDFDQWLKTLGLQATSITSLTDLPNNSHSLLFVPPDSDLTPLTGSMGTGLERYVAHGGKVMFFPQSHWPQIPVAPARLRQDSERTTTVAFLGRKDHPLLQGLTDRDLRFWPGDQIVSRDDFYRPDADGAQALLTAGGRSGLSWSPLVWLPHGEGWYLFCQLQLQKKWKETPTAPRLMQNILDYATQPRSSPQPLYVVNDKNSWLAPLREIGIQSRLLTSPEQLKNMNDGWIWIGPGDWTSIWSGEVMRFVSRGGHVWLMDWTGPAFEDLARQFGLNPIASSLSGYHLTKTSQSGLLSAVANYDLFWAGSSLGGPKPIVPIARFALAPYGSGKIVNLDRMTQADGKPISQSGWGKPTRFKAVAKFDKEAGTLTWTVDQQSAGHYYVALVARVADQAPQAVRQVNSAYVTPPFTWTLKGLYHLSLNDKPLTLVEDQGSVEVTVRHKNWSMPYGDLITEAPLTLHAGDKIIVQVKAGAGWVAGLELFKARIPNKQVELLTHPASLVQLNQGEGSILLDGVDWKAGIDKARTQATSALNHLAGRMGLQFSNPATAHFADAPAAIVFGVNQAALKGSASVPAPHIERTAALHGRFRQAIALQQKGQEAAWTVPSTFANQTCQLELMARVANKDVTQWDLADMYRIDVNGEPAALAPYYPSSQITHQSKSWAIIYGLLHSKTPVSLRAGDRITVHAIRSGGGFVAQLRLVPTQNILAWQSLALPADAATELEKPVVLHLNPFQRIETSHLWLLSEKTGHTLSVPCHHAKGSHLALIHSFYHPWTDFPGQYRGRPVARYTLYYANGETRSFDVRYLEEVATPLDDRDVLPGAAVVWTGHLRMKQTLDSLTGQVGSWIQKERPMHAYRMTVPLEPSLPLDRIELKQMGQGVVILYGMQMTP